MEVHTRLQLWQGWGVHTQNSSGIVFLSFPWVFLFVHFNNLLFQMCSLPYRPSLPSHRRLVLLLSASPLLLSWSDVELSPCMWNLVSHHARRRAVTWYGSVLCHAESSRHGRGLGGVSLGRRLPPQTSAQPRSPVQCWESRGDGGSGTRGQSPSSRSVLVHPGPRGRLVWQQRGRK